MPCYVATSKGDRVSMQCFSCIESTEMRWCGVFGEVACVRRHLDAREDVCAWRLDQSVEYYQDSKKV